ncbi:hypothetical protein LTS15_004949 [Exophiala xenobiotica]|nr:hypothetical protein LTS15_004949 [Exophiala xenobiotica]
MVLQPMRAPDLRYYFAYGSNMSLTQMAERCPSSLFMGKGRIDGYRWQINERGVANIVQSARDFVEGVVYQIDTKDKRQLDRSEGVARGLYDDEHLYTRFRPLPNCGIKTFHVAKELEMDDQLDPEQREHQRSVPRSRSGSVREVPKPQYQSPPRYPRQESLEMVEALVYVSREYRDDGSIRPEYIGRMEKAIIDGRKMGLSDPYLNHIDRIIHQEAPPRQNNDAFQTSYGPYERMETGGANHEPYKILETTQPTLEQHQRVPEIRSSYPTYVDVVTVRPSYPFFDDLDDNVMYRETRYVDDESFRPRCDSGRQPETRERRGDRSPTSSKENRGRAERRGATSTRLITRRTYVDGRLVKEVVERRKRSSSTPY